MINFIQDNTENYSHRTKINAYNSDFTLAFGMDFSTLGEKCTVNACKLYNKPLIQIPLNCNINIASKYIINNKNLFKNIDLSKCNIINIAGNGIYTLNKYNISQKNIDNFIYNILLNLKNNNFNFNVIRSGGQSGADEAGIKAAEKLKINSICLSPLFWKFRDINNIDIKNEIKFKQRFYG